VERRYISFIAISLAAILAGQALQTWLYPPKPRAENKDAVQAGTDAAGLAGPPADPQAADGGIASVPAAAAGADAEIAAAPSGPRVRRTLGSLDAASPARMLVTLTSRGAAIERIELADEQFHDQDDRSGYLGHLAVETVPQGCRIGIVGPGTPAARAGLLAGDVIVRIADAAVADVRSLGEILAATKPRQRVTIGVLRDGGEKTVEAVLERRPLEVIRPEFRGQPVADPDGDRHDPLSFRLSLESRDGRKRPEPFAEIPGHELADVDWQSDATADGAGVRFTRPLPGGLTAVKEYRLVPAAEGEDAGYRLSLTVELRAAEAAGDAGPARESIVTYAIDGPTGLPTEGWWYAQRVARDWSNLAVRDVAMRFDGEPTTLVSGLKIADQKLDHPASAVRAGKPLSFAGVDALYFASALIPAGTGPDAPALAEVRPLAVGEPPAAAKKKLVDVTPRLVSKEISLAPGAGVSHRYEIFAGPKKPELLRQFGAKAAAMDDLVYYGWFGWVARPLIAILHGLHAVIGNYGIAIILLTVMVRGAMFPLSRKQAISSQKMQALQPEMKALADKYKNDPEKRTRATQELWHKHKVNPVSGCLPVFIQIPIFMGLYRSLATDVELRQAPLFSSAIRWCSNLAAPDMLWDWSKVLPEFLTAPEAWLGPFLNLFPLITIGLMLWQQKLFMPPAVDEQQKMQQQVMNYMMWFMALMFFKVPCGLCLYFIASSLWGIAERLWMPKALPAAAAGAVSSAGGRTLDVPFTAAAKAGSNGAADSAREKRQARKKQR
jgi:YidC/Oxa1 family membrane protein insertase